MTRKFLTAKDEKKLGFLFNFSFACFTSTKKRIRTKNFQNNSCALLFFFIINEHNTHTKKILIKTRQEEELILCMRHKDSNKIFSHPQDVTIWAIDIHSCTDSGLL